MVVAALIGGGCGGGDKPKQTTEPTTLSFEAAAAPELPREIGPGDPVRITGVNVGEVTNVTRSPSGALVQMRIRLHPVWPITSGAWPPRTNAWIKVYPRIFKRGDYWIDLRPGTFRAPALEDGARLPASHTHLYRGPMELFGRGA
jgi:hypothetical protein